MQEESLVPTTVCAWCGHGNNTPVYQVISLGVAPGKSEESISTYQKKYQIRCNNTFYLDPRDVTINSEL